MGRFKVEFEVANYLDLELSRQGKLDPALVRKEKLQGVIDSGATSLVLPGKVVKKLGLQGTDKVRVTYANGQTGTRPIVDGVYLELMGRHGIFSAISEPRRDTALLGAIVLEEMDYLIDCKNQRLYPRDPNFRICEIEETRWDSK